jgi:transmembrane sensor
MGLLAGHRTGVGGQRTATLPDGTAVVLGGNSALSVAYGARVRRVTLHHGEGLFTVGEDPRRPFVVAAANGRIAALGTVFDVKRDDSAVEIAVASGAVEVSAGPGAPVRLGPGQAVRYDSAGVGPPQATGTAQIGLWRDGRLSYRETPLASVLRDLDRYRRGRILLTDARLAALRVTGDFDTRRPDAALDAIARTLPIRLTHLTDLVVLVRPSE